MRVCKHGCGVTEVLLFARLSRKHKFEKVFKFKTPQVYFIYPFLQLESRYKEGVSIFFSLKLTF